MGNGSSKRRGVKRVPSSPNIYGRTPIIPVNPMLKEHRCWHHSPQQPQYHHASLQNMLNGMTTRHPVPFPRLTQPHDDKTPPAIRHPPRVGSTHSTISSDSSSEYLTPIKFDSSKRVIESDPMVFVAVYDHMAESEQELNVSRGENVTILDDSDNNWWFVRNSRLKVGYVPSRILREKSIVTSAEPWFLGCMSRADAEQYLTHHVYHEGNFLIRESETKPGILVLSLKAVESLSSFKKDIIKHYLIRRKTDGRYLLRAEDAFESLSDLVDHYSTSPDGLCTTLVKPGWIEAHDASRIYGLF